MQNRKLPLWVIGAIVGALLTISLIALSYLGSRVLGLPFVGFEFFDWLGRVLPGGLVTFAIDSIVAVIRSLNLGPTATTAKLAEQIMGVGAIITLGAVAGAIFFALAPRINAKNNYLAGVVLGVLVGIAMLLIIAAVGRPAQIDPLVSGVWTLALFTVWGFAHNWVYNDLTRTGKVIKSDGTVLEVEGIDRRQFLLRLGGATATITVIGAGLGALLGQREQTAQIAASSANAANVDGTRWSANNELPNASAALEPAPGTRPEFTALENHYRIDINSIPPVVDGETWRLTINGLVENPLELTMEQIQAYEPIDRFVTLSCISNPIAGDLIGTQLWTGASLKRILEDARPNSTASYIKMTAADGFYEYVSIEKVMEDERVMLAYYWDGVPLEIEHGFPLRIYIPDRYGMKQPKWLTGLELIDSEEEGFWVQRGWDAVARVNTTSVIDTVAANDTYERDGTMYVPVGGIAYAGARSISKVEVRVDDGNWVQAQLRTPISDTTWVVWRYDWAFAQGRHTFEVRAVDGDNVAQEETSRSVRPSGATGIHSLNRTL